MDRTEPPGGRTDDLSWAMQPDAINQRCFFCRRPGATGKASLKNTEINCCPPGEGCKDGRVRHGPPSFAVHWPDDPCADCGRNGRPSTGRRLAGNRARPVRRPATNLKPWQL